MTEITPGVVVAALYRFARFPEFETYRQPLLDCLLAAEVRGTLLLAAEGINGTIAGPRGRYRSGAWLLAARPALCRS